MPQRIQLRRTKGWLKPEGTIVVARPSKWGNPFRVGALDAYWSGPGRHSPTRPNPIPTMDAQHVVDIYRRMVETNSGELFSREDVVAELRGRDLACWCRLGAPCHADVLLEIANGGST